MIRKRVRPASSQADTLAPLPASKVGRHPAASRFHFPFMQACRAAYSHILSTRGGAPLCPARPGLEQRAAWATPRLRHMGLDGRVMALGAAALGLTLTWLHRRQASRHRSGGSNGNGSNHCRGVKLVPRGRPLVAQPDEVSLVSYNILCERCGGLCGAAVGARVGVPAPPDSAPVNPAALPCQQPVPFESGLHCSLPTDAAATLQVLQSTAVTESVCTVLGP